MDFRLGWILMVLITVLGIVVLLLGHRRWVVLGLAYAYGMFGTAPIQHILGATWRNQHQLSRHYLLSLPISHKRLFQIQQLRILVFCIPFLLLTSVLPFFLGNTANETVAVFVLYFYNLLLSLGLFVHSMIWLTLEMERIASYVPRRERVWMHIKFALAFICFFTIPSFVWQDLLRALGKETTLKSLTFFCLAAMTATLTLLFRRNQSRWCVTQTVNNKNV